MSYNPNHKSYGTNDGCNYARLGAYNAGFKGIRPPVPMTTTYGYYVVPNYSAPGYDTLTHGGPRGPGGCIESSNGYFQIDKAYGYGSNNCRTTYSASLCG